jgi:hypothetical protein
MEVIDDELALAGEKIAQAFLAVRTGAHIVLLNPLPGQRTALLAQGVARAGEVFFFGEELLASLDPLLVRNDFMLAHDCPPCT